MTRFGFGVLLVACTGENVIEKQNNAAPNILIASHSDGVSVQEGYVEYFRATVSDDDNPFDELSVAWYVGDQLVCDWATASPAGESFCEIVFAPDDTNVIAEVRDPQGAGGLMEVSIEVSPTQAPTAAIYTPLANQTYYSNQLVQFSGLIGDLEDEVGDLVVTWSSSLDGELPLNNTPDTSGEISDYGYLTEGQHVIELRVEDSSQKIITDEVVVQVGGDNTVPSCSIVEPVDGAAVTFGDAVIFRGLASDEELLSTELSFVWLSDKDGSLGSGAINSEGEITFSYSDLTADNHVITLRVEDEVEATCQDTIIVTVGNPPIASIDQPLNGEVFSVGDNITFRGTVGDLEDQGNEIQVIWTSSLDGELANQNANSQGFSQFSIGSLSSGVHDISFSAIDTTGLIGDDLISVRVNTAPTQPSLNLVPDPAYAGATLAVTAFGSQDADGDVVTYSYAWYENGVVTSYTGTSIPSSETEVGEQWLVQVTPTDGYVNGPYAEAFVTISNTDPTISSISISPTSVYNDDVVTCTATASDPDETVAPGYSWLVNGVTYTGDTLDLSTTSALPGDVVECTALVNDSNGGSASSSIGVSVDNRPPTVSVSVSPNVATTSSVLSCLTNPFDPDGEQLNTLINWSVGGVSVGNGATLSLDPTMVSPTDQVTCEVTVMDASGASANDSQSATIQNTDPSISAVYLTPTGPTATDTLHCSAVVSDADGESPNLSYSFSNLNTGQAYAPTTQSSFSATLDLSALTVQAGESIECTTTATDFYGGSATATTSVTVVNTAPSFASGPSISPNSGVVVGTTLTCSATATDPDDGAIGSTYEWIVAGISVGTGSTYTVSGSDVPVGGTVICQATAVDSDGESVSASDTVTVGNTDPVVNSVGIGSATGFFNDSVWTCVASVSDPNETVSPNYTWTLSGTAVGYSASLDLAATTAMPGDIVSCVVDVSDSSGGTATDSASESVVNRAPSAPTVSVSPSSPIAGQDDLVCSASGSADPDGSPITYAYSWTSDGGQSVSGASVSAAVTQPNETWTCGVYATDGVLNSSTTTSAITVNGLWSGEREFTTCGSSGQNGPDQSACTSTYLSTTLEGEVTVSSGIQQWTVPETGTYTIEALGAKGGDKSSSVGGSGARIVGDFSLTAGDVLYVIVGQKGLNADTSGIDGGGGGGGSFVYTSSGTLLVIAGGGGGTSYQYNSGYGGSASQSSVGGGYGQSSSGNGGGSDNGGGGGCGSGGGGWIGSGTGNNWSSGGASAGGVGGNSGYSRHGGFGGGGGSFHGGGGGGGYTGGGGGTYTIGGGGAGSYNSGSNQSNTAGYNSADGMVIISQ